MRPTEFSEILQKYIDGICTPEESLMVEKWCDYIMEKERKEIGYPVESKAKIYEKIIRARAATSYKQRKISYFSITEAMAAALVIGLLGLALFAEFPWNSQKSQMALREINGNSHSVVVNNSASPMKVHFEDGTEVLLDPKSQLSEVNFTQTSRNLRLEGRAFFKVARNPQRPFSIYTNNITTKVLGTSFIIDARAGGEETVVVKTGKVAVYKKQEGKTKSKESFVTVTPNLQVHYSKADQTLTPSIVERPLVIPATEHDIMNGRNSDSTPLSPKMVFAGARVADIFKALESAYGIQIKCDAAKLGNCVMTITLLDEDLYTRLYAVCAAVGATFKIDGTQILIENGGC